jgi:nicotinate-nucleotide--dimethylbenzimidazole phosphoribosyltransferase
MKRRGEIFGGKHCKNQVCPAKTFKMDLFEAIKKRRDTRHFEDIVVPKTVIDICLDAAKNAPSVGLTDPARFLFIDEIETRRKIYELFVVENKKAVELIGDEAKKKLYESLKLQGIAEAPLGMVVCVDYSPLEEFTIGTIYTKETLDWSVCCAIQNFWLALTAQGFSMGWVSILDYKKLGEIVNLPEHYKPLGYFCIGKPSTNYDNMPMLKQKGWKK